MRGLISSAVPCPGQAPCRLLLCKPFLCSLVRIYQFRVTVYHTFHVHQLLAVLHRFQMFLHGVGFPACLLYDAVSFQLRIFQNRVCLHIHRPGRLYFPEQGFCRGCSLTQGFKIFRGYHLLISDQRLRMWDVLYLLCSQHIPP